MKKPSKNATQRSLKKPLLKIGFVFDDSLDSYDGVAQYVKTLGSWYTQQGHEVRYLVGETKMQEWAGGKVYSLSKNQKVSFNGNQVRIPLPANRRRIKQVIKNENFDVLHIQVPYSPFMAQKVIRAAGPKVAVIGTFHILPNSLLSEWGSRLLKLMYLRSLKRFDTIVSVSSAAAKFAKSAYGLDTKVLPNVVEVGRFAAARKKPKKEVEQIVFLGRLVKRKGCEELIKAFNLLNKVRSKTQLVIAGKGPEETKLKILVKSLNLGKPVEFLGFIDEEDKPALLASADIACFPSLGGESFGIVLIEAMAAGSGVVIGGNNLGYSTVLAPQPKVLVNPKDHETFAKTLEEFLDNKNLFSKVHNWQLSEVKRYDVANVGSELLKLYNESIAKRARIGDN
jgi:phosphatidylinositol alpha-mannosyltransferase